MLLAHFNWNYLVQDGTISVAGTMDPGDMDSILLDFLRDTLCAKLHVTPRKKSQVEIKVSVHSNK